MYVCIIDMSTNHIICYCIYARTSSTHVASFSSNTLKSLNGQTRQYGYITIGKETVIDLH